MAPVPDAVEDGAAAVILISFDPRRLAQMYGMEEPASAEEGRQARLQAAVMGFSGFILLLPMVFAVIGLAPAIALGLIVLLFAAHTALNLKLNLQTCANIVACVMVGPPSVGSTNAVLRFAGVV